MKNNNVLKEYRKNHKYSAQQVADAIGLSLSFYYNIENEKRSVTSGVAIKLAEFYRVPVDSILGLEPVENSFYFEEVEIEKMLFDLKANMNEAVVSGLLTTQEKIIFFKETCERFEFLLFCKKRN